MGSTQQGGAFSSSLSMQHPEHMRGLLAGQQSHVLPTPHAAARAAQPLPLPTCVRPFVEAGEGRQGHRVALSLQGVVGGSTRASTAATTAATTLAATTCRCTCSCR